MDDSRSWFALDVDAKTVTFRPDEPEKDARTTLSYSRQAGGQLVLEGVVNGGSVTMHLQRRERPFLLVSRGFHWVQESPVNQ